MSSLINPIDLINKEQLPKEFIEEFENSKGEDEPKGTQFGPTSITQEYVGKGE